MTLTNDFLTIKIKEVGAELMSIINNANKKEYLWKADPQFWKRHSPILFPIVGSLYNNQYTYNQQNYTLTQHGFARDMDFTLFYQRKNKVGYYLDNNKETLQNYPFKFRLEIFYELDENTIKVIWKVFNTDTKTIYFQIGGHPAFNHQDFNQKDDVKGYFLFEVTSLDIDLIAKNGGGLDLDRKYRQKLKENILPITNKIFENDALVIQDRQINNVSLLNKNKEKYLSLTFDAPVAGLWSPKGSSPFVCIEPWYGRCDLVNYKGEFTEKDWVNNLEEGGSFEAFYTIEIF